MSPAQYNHQPCPETSFIHIANDELQRCSRPCSYDAKTQGQKFDNLCGNALFSPEMFFDIWILQIITQCEFWGLRRIFEHLKHRTSFCTSRLRWGAALAWSKMIQRTSSTGCSRWTSYSVWVISNMGRWSWYQLAGDGKTQFQFCWRTWYAWLSVFPGFSTEEH